MSSFIQKINDVADKLFAIQEASDLFNEDIVAEFSKLAEMDISQIAEDFKKGNYLGNRKIDIDLALNNTHLTEEVSYSKAVLTLNNGIVVDIPFQREGVTEEVTSYTALYNYIIEGIDSFNLNEPDANNKIVNYEIDVINQTILDLPTLLRIRDRDGKACNIDRVTLSVYGGGSAVETNPNYFWAKTTSSLQTLANRIGDIIALGNDIDSIIVLSSRVDEFLELQSNISELIALHTDLTKLIELHTNLDEILLVDDNAAIVSNKLVEVSNIRDSIHNVTARAISGSSTAPASATFNPSSSEIVIVVPEGAKGDKGEPFQVNSIDNLSGRSIYDDRPKNFSFLAIDEGNIYFKTSDVVGEWSTGIPFGKGEKGDTGADGNAIVGIQKTATSGNVDTYTITFTDGTTYSYNVANASLDDSSTSLQSSWSSLKIQTDMDEQTATLGDMMWKQNLVANNLKIEGVA